MKWWVSWYGDPEVPFEYHGPWWISGYEAGGEGRKTICAAVCAPDEGGEEGAREVIVEAHDAPVELEWRFVEARLEDWAPFGDRFPRAPWMLWA